MKDKILRGNLYLGILTFILSTLLLVFDSPFMQTWYYIFAWWSFLLVLDSVNYRSKGTSPFSEGFSTILFMALVSICSWLLFELFNLRLKNWAYFNLPSNLFLRWLGYCLAFATVIPALIELSLLFQRFFRRKKIIWLSLKPTRFHLSASVVFGCLFLGGTLLWPDLLFPLVWLGVYFLIEPINYRLKASTFLADLETGNWGNFAAWILSGLAAGILWEFWNFWAGSHWEYSLPYLDFWRVFQMPVFGYLGFLPFALEIFVLWNLALTVQKKIKGSAFLSAVIIFVMLLFCVASFTLMDQWTVVP